MSKVIKDYIKSQKALKRYFDCQEDYLIKELTTHKWQIIPQEGIVFLQYWNDDNNKAKAVVVNKNEKPLIYATEEYTMVIAIDCIKIAFVFSNVNKI